MSKLRTKTQPDKEAKDRDRLSKFSEAILNYSDFSEFLGSDTMPLMTALEQYMNLHKRLPSEFPLQIGTRIVGRVRIDWEEVRRVVDPLHLLGMEASEELARRYLYELAVEKPLDPEKLEVFSRTPPCPPNQEDALIFILACIFPILQHAPEKLGQAMADLVELEKRKSALRYAKEKGWRFDPDDRAAFVRKARDVVKNLRMSGKKVNLTNISRGLFERASNPLRDLKRQLKRYKLNLGDLKRADQKA